MDKNKLIPGSVDYKKALAAIIIAGAAAFCMEYCLQPVISKIAATFTLKPAQASIAVSAAMLGMALTLFILTSFADRLPRRKMLAGSLIVSSAVLMGVSFIQSFAAIVALRFAQGCILALVPVLAMAYVNEEFTAGKTAFGIGMYVCGTTLGGLTGRISTSVLTDFVGWQHAITIISGITAVIGILVLFMLPPDHHIVPKNAKTFSLAVFNKKNKKLFYLCLAAFCMMGSFMASYNFISYVLKDAPYNLSQSVIGFLYGVQIFGTLSSAVSGKLSAKFGSGKIIVFSLLLIAAGAVITLHTALIIKIAGLAVLTVGLFGAHSSASGWSGKLVKTDKAAAGSLYMFSYYSGASILGSLGGVFYEMYGWGGVVAMSIACVATALAAIRMAIK